MAVHIRLHIRLQAAGEEHARLLLGDDHTVELLLLGRDLRHFFLYGRLPVSSNWEVLILGRCMTGITAPPEA